MRVYVLAPEIAEKLQVNLTGINTTSYPGSFHYAPRWRKDPGPGWSRVSQILGDNKLFAQGWGAESEGGGLSLFYRSSCRYQFDKVQSVCILTNVCNFNERQELVLQNQWVRCLCICILCGLHLRRRYARSIRTGVFQFHLGKIAKNY